MGTAEAVVGRRSGAERLETAVRRRWDRIDWSASIPEARLVVPEAHYMSMEGLGLTRAQRVGLNRLFVCFTCELFVHFEAYLIVYLERSAHRIPSLSPALVARFAAEERVHTEMFRRLLSRLRPDLYPHPAESDAPLRFLRWRASDDLVLELSPPGTFFLLAWLFEEITLFVPEVLAAAPHECAPLVTEVMALHAREEASHVAIDAHVMAYLTEHCPRWWTGLQSTLTVPLLVYVDTRVRRAWQRVVSLAADELGLTRRQVARLRARGPSASDRLGMQSFVAKMARDPLAGTGLLCWALQRAAGPAPVAP